jgi:hypothetical protein
MEYTAKKIGKGVYEYRGYTIERDDFYSAGYSCYWGVVEEMMVGSTLRACKASIDEKLGGEA